MARRKRRTPRRRSPQTFWFRDELLQLLRAWGDVQSEDNNTASASPPASGSATGVPPALNEKKGSSLLLPDAQLEPRIYQRFCTLVLKQSNRARPTTRSESDALTQLRDLIVSLEAVSASQRDQAAAAAANPALRRDDVDPELMTIFEEIRRKKKSVDVLLVSSLEADKNAESTTPVMADVPSDSPATKEELMLVISAWQTVLDRLNAIPAADVTTSVDVDAYIFRRCQLCNLTRATHEMVLQWKQVLRDTHKKLSKFQSENDDRDWFALSASVRSLVQATWELRERDNSMAFVDMDRGMFDELTTLFEKEREFDLKQNQARFANRAPEHTVGQRAVEGETKGADLRGNAAIGEDAQAGIGLSSKRKQPASEITEDTPEHKKSKTESNTSTSLSLPSTPTDEASELVVGSTWTRSQLLTLFRAHHEMSPRQDGESLVSIDDRIYKRALSLDNRLANRTQRDMVDHKRKILQSREFIADFNNNGRYNGTGASSERKSWFSLTHNEQMKIVKSKFSRPQFVFLDAELYDQLDVIAGANELLLDIEWSDKEPSLALTLRAWRKALAVAPLRPADAEEDDSLDFLQRYRSLCDGMETRTDSSILQQMHQLRATYNAIMHYSKTKQADALDADWWFSLPVKKKYDEIVLNWSKWKDCVRITRDTFDTLALIIAKEQNSSQHAASVQLTASVSGDSAAEMQQDEHLLPTPVIPPEDTQIEHEHDDLDTCTRERSASPSQATGFNDAICRLIPVDHAEPQTDNLEESGVESVVSNTPVVDNTVEGDANGVTDRDIVHEHVNATLDSPSSHTFEQEPTSFLRVPRSQYPPTQFETIPETRTQLGAATVLPIRQTETDAAHSDPLRQIPEEESASFLRVSGNQHVEPTRCDTTTPEQRSLLEMINHLDHQAIQLGVLIQQLKEEKIAAREERQRERRERKLQREQQGKLESARRRNERSLEKEKDQKLLKELFGKK